MTGFRAFVAFLGFLLMFGAVGTEVSVYQLTAAVAGFGMAFWATNHRENG